MVSPWSAARALALCRADAGWRVRTGTIVVRLKQRKHAANGKHVSVGVENHLGELDRVVGLLDGFLAERSRLGDSGHIGTCQWLRGSL